MERLKDELKDIKLYILDMDGTIYLEDKIIPGAKAFVDGLIAENKDYIFMSNNSSVSKNVYLDKLKKLNIVAKEENLFSSSMAMGEYLKRFYPDKRVYVVGTKKFEEELRNYDVRIVEAEAEIVVVGYDSELTYEKLRKACAFIDSGALFLATNPDLVYPLKNKRYIPDCGSICMMITNATKKEPLYVGKPNNFMIEVIMSKYNYKLEEVVIVGDRLYTDILMGVNAGIKSILVLSGEATTNGLNNSKIKPTYIVESIEELI